MLCIQAFVSVSDLLFDLQDLWSSNLLLVGINYDRQTKTHECKIQFIGHHS